VLKFDPAAVKALLQGKEVPDKIKRKIADLAEVVSTYPRLWIKTLKDDKEE